MFYNPNDVKDWSDQLKQYEISRKFTPKLEPYKKISHSMAKEKEVQFHPILQTFKTQNQDKEFENKQDLAKSYQLSKKMGVINKYEQDYDIINLNKNRVQEKPYLPQKTFKILPHHSFKYNIITNEHFYPEDEKKQINDYMLMLSTKYGKKLNRKFDIISNENFTKYDPEFQEEYAKLQTKLKNKYDKTHDFNLLTGSYYDEEKEKQFIKFFILLGTILFLRQRQDMAQTHGIYFNKRLPPAWKYREPLILDRTKPIPEELKIVDQRRNNAKKRYNIRYILENEYRDRDIDRQELEKFRKLNRINQKKFFDEQQKGFDLITMENYQEDEIRPKKVFQSSWDQLKLNSNFQRPINQISEYYSPQIQQKKYSESRKPSEILQQPVKAISQISSQSCKSNSFSIKSVGFNLPNKQN